MFVLLALLVAPAGATPTDVSEEAELRFSLGVRAYRDEQYEEALLHLLAANRLAPNLNVEFNLARCYEQLGQLDLAWRHYDLVARTETDAEGRASAERARERLEDRVARVRVTSDPPGASVYVQRKDLGSRGTTPLTLALTPGEHALLLSLPGHADASVRATLKVGAEASVSMSLAPDGEPPAPEGPTWTATRLRVGGQVLVEATPGACALPMLGVGGVARVPATPVPGPPPGAALGDGPITLSVTLSEGGREWTRTLPLTRPDKKRAALADASAPSAWLFDRCAPADGPAVAAALAALPTKTRLDALAVLGEWAAVSGADPSTAVAACAAGDCASLGALLAAPKG